MPPMPPITQALLLINVGIFCLQFLLGYWFPLLFGLWPWGHGFLPWQVVSYTFLHEPNFLQLFFNMLGLWMFGSELENLWGTKRYLQYYFASVVTAAFTHLALAALFDSAGPMLGASGALFGLLLAFGMMFPNRTIMPLFPPIPMKAKVFVTVFGAIQLILGWMGRGNDVSHLAALGGMLGGFLMIQYWRGGPPFGQGRGRRR